MNTALLKQLDQCMEKGKIDKPTNRYLRKCVKNNRTFFRVTPFKGTPWILFSELEAHFYIEGLEAESKKYKLEQVRARDLTADELCNILLPIDKIL